MRITNHYHQLEWIWEFEMKAAMLVGGAILLGLALFWDMASAPRYAALLAASGVCAAGAIAAFAIAFRRCTIFGKVVCGAAVALAAFVLLDVIRRSLL